jgi:hypothetical protein
MLIKSVIFALLSIILAVFSGCNIPINPKTTYTVYTVITPDGRKYENLKPDFMEGHYIDVVNNTDYEFHGNYTVISGKISGEEYLRLKGLESKSNY